MRQLTVSRSSSRFLQQGHPWIRVDRFTRGLDALRSGEAVTLVDERGKPLGSALADPEQEICARVYHQAAGKSFDCSAALERAVARRQKLIDDSETDCYRLVHGEADFLPGLRIEALGPSLVISLRAPCIAAYRQDIIDYCQRRFPDLRIIVKEQFDDLRKHPLRISDAAGETIDPDWECRGRELGTEVCLFPAQGLATGIYVDQRATRQFLRQHCTNKRVANAFAYTGLFAINLLQAGAGSAIDIDIAAPALAVAQRNAAINKVSDRHQMHVGDAIAYFQETQNQFDIIILDPPTAAHGKGKQKGKNDGQWILRRDYPHLLTAAIERLDDGGMLVACCNTLGSKKQFDLQRHLRQAFPALRILDNPALGSDIPQRKGFPEGRPYQLLIAQKQYS